MLLMDMLPGIDNNQAQDTQKQIALSSCPICTSRRLHYAFSRNGYRVVRCDDCRLMLLNPQPSDTELMQIYSESYFLGENTEVARQRVASMKAATARSYLDEIKRYTGTHGARLLEIGCGHGDFLVEAQKYGYDVTGIEISDDAAHIAQRRLGHGHVICGTIDSVALAEHQFDICAISDVIEHVRDPLLFLQQIHRLLKPDGVLFIATPSLDSWSARLLRQNWMEFKPEHLFYFDTNTIQHALYKSDFEQSVVLPGRKILNLDYVSHHFQRFQVPLITPLMQLLTDIMPDWLRYKNVSIVASGMMVLTRAASKTERKRLSVIVPAYNEGATFTELMDGLLAKSINDLDIEIIVVESHSTDGTREKALAYQHHPRVTLVLEDRPQGKGHAVRTGFQYATGDFILIQDADLEYDLEDYDVLLEPLIQGRDAFVLGSRHGGNAWKMRHFTEQPMLSFGLNFGHWFFASLVNLLFALRLKDPFTMYKVFRRDCLTGLTFQCNRFDFDYELLIKLARKGFIPREIPVNYRSRSFQEGKKVSVFRDPLTWVVALIRLRMAHIEPLKQIEQQRGQQ